MSASPEDRLRAAGVRKVVHLSVVRPEPPPREDVPEWAMVEPEPDVPEPDPTEPGSPKSPLWVRQGPWNPAEIPRRPWLAPGYLLRGSVSILGGAGGGGKSSLVVCWTISAATGRDVGEFRPVAPMVVINYNVEDDADEQERRYTAALDLERLSCDAITDRVIRCGPHDVGTLFERDPSTGRVLPTTAMDTLERLARDSGADCIVCDPLAELHNSEENDNTAMRAVVAAFRSMARRLNIAVLLLHHDKKGTNAPGDMDRLRGASAVSGAVRVALTLSTMSQEEADKFGIAPEHRRAHFRVDGAKSNYAPVQDAEWWKLQGVEIANGETIGACRPWTPPSTFDGLSMGDCVDVLDAINKGTERGHAWGSEKNSKDDWAGHLLTAKGKSEEQAKQILRAWEGQGTLTKSDQDGPRRGHKRQAYTVNMAKVAEMRRDMRGPPQ
jgi:hypothetical protein